MGLRVWRWFGLHLATRVWEFGTSALHCLQAGGCADSKSGTVRSLTLGAVSPPSNDSY